MITHVKKYGIIALMAILFTAFSFSVVEVFDEAPEYGDFCEIERAVMPLENRSNLTKDNLCYNGYETAMKQHRMVGFIITAILGLVAVIAGMYASSKRNVIDWIYSGLLIGGIITITFGTMSYFRDMGRFVRPVILLAEMALIAWVALRTAKKKIK